MKKFLTIFSQRRSSSVSCTSQRPQCQHRATRHHSTTQPPKYEAYGKIHKAASLGDVAKVQCRLELAKNGANDRDRNNRTPLHYACAHGHPDVVTLLLDWNCDIDLCDSYNSTPLIKASQYDHEECMTILLEHGADPNAIDKSGSTALHYAIFTENISMITKLLEYNADANITNKGGVSPLILAQHGSNEDLKKVLVSHIKKTQEVDEPDSMPSGSNSCGSSSPKEAKDKFQESLQPLTEAASEEKMQGQLQRQTELEAEETGQQTLVSTSLVTEKTKKHNVNTLDTSENLNLGAATSAQQIQDEKAEDQQITVENQVNDGSVMETSEAKNKVKEVNNTFDPNKFVLPYERNSEDREMLSFDKILSLIEQLMKDSKDTGSLMRISSAVHSYRKSLELKTHDFELLQETHKNLKNNLSAIQKKVSKTVKEKLKVDMENTKLKAEMHNLRLKLENSSLKIQATTKHQAEETEQNQKTQNELIQTLTQSLEDGNKRNSKLEKEIARLKLENSSLKIQATTKHQAEETEQNQKTQNELIQTLTQSLEDGNKRNSKLEKEIARLKLENSSLKIQATTKHQAEETEQNQKTQNELIQTLTQSLEDGNKRNSKLEKEIARLKLENSSLKIQATTKHQAEETEQNQKTQNELIQTLTQSLEDGYKRNSKLEKEIARLKLENSSLKIQATTKHQAEETEQNQKTQNELIQTLTQSLEDGNKRNSKLEKEIARLKLENSDLQAATKHQAEENEQIQKTQNELIQLLAHGLKTGKRRNSDLQKEISRLKLEYSDLQATTKHQAEESEQIQITQDELIQTLTWSLEDGNKRNIELEKEITRLKLENSDLQATTKHGAEETEQIGRIQNDLIQSLTHSFEDEKKRNSELEKEITRLKLENSDLQATTKHGAEETEQIGRIQNALIQSLTHSFEDEKKRNSELEKEITRLKLENSELQATTKHEAEEIERIRRTQTSEITTLLTKQNALIQLLTHSFEHRMRRNSELEKEVTRFKKQSDECENGEPASCSASSTIHWEKEKQHTLSYCQCLENENDFLQQKLLEVTGAPKKNKMLEERLKKHEEEIFSLKNHMGNHMVERSERQAAPDKYKEQVMRMKQSIKDMQKKILGMKSREHSTKVSLEMYKQFYIAELNAREVLKEEHANLSSTNKRLQHENSRLAFEIKKYRHIYNHKDRKSAITGISDGNLQNDFWTLQDRNTCWEPLFPNESLESPLGGTACWGNLI